MGGLCAGEGALLSPLSLTLPLPLSLCDEQRNLHKISSREKQKREKAPLSVPAEKFARKRRGGHGRAKGRRSRRRLSG